MHFDFVKSEDLEKIGMGRPAIRRLMDAVKRRKSLRKKGLLDKVSICYISLPFCVFSDDLIVREMCSGS